MARKFTTKHKHDIDKEYGKEVQNLAYLAYNDRANYFITAVKENNEQKALASVCEAYEDGADVIMDAIKQTVSKGWYDVIDKLMCEECLDEDFLFEIFETAVMSDQTDIATITYTISHRDNIMPIASIAADKGMVPVINVLKASFCLNDDEYDHLIKKARKNASPKSLAHFDMSDALVKILSDYSFVGQENLQKKLSKFFDDHGAALKDALENGDLFIQEEFNRAFPYHIDDEKTNKTFDPFYMEGSGITAETFLTSRLYAIAADFRDGIDPYDYDRRAEWMRAFINAGADISADDYQIVQDMAYAQYTDEYREYADILIAMINSITDDEEREIVYEDAIKAAISGVRLDTIEALYNNLDEPLDYDIIINFAKQKKEEMVAELNDTNPLRQAFNTNTGEIEAVIVYFEREKELSCNANNTATSSSDYSPAQDQ